MASEIPEITQSNRQLTDHIIADLHDILKLLRKHDALLEEFRPLLDQFRSPAATFITRRAARRNGANQDPA